jgi:predicted transcriptional regulator
MKSVLMSIQPKWCELIANGKKTIEVRKTKPKLETPFKVYIYCTEKDYDKTFYIDKFMHKVFLNGNGKQKVIGEFVCDSVKMSFVGYNEKGCPSYWDILDGSCLTPNELVCYGEWKTLYGWHISNLVIYDKPRALNEFKKHNRTCYYDHLGLATPKCKDCKDCQVTRPPQSWCYIESGDTE